ncbi:acyltransferase [Leucobacter massiliensis]|uniref:acyltransferase n=1 Tax=Leucobacter massiliensis TaxID=1686285 RepID=UPI001FE8740D|nr:acyltransferase family protein [Leucobacter massiliensis]
MTEAPEQQRTRAGRVEYFDVLRAVAIVAVVGIHAAITEWHQAPVTAQRWEELTWINAALRFCVPVFFMISGALFLSPHRAVTVRELFRKRIPRILVAFAVWSLVYGLIEVYGPGGSGSFGELVTRFFQGHFHLWFLLALTGLYLATPILRLVVRERRVAWYFVWLALPFASVLPLLTRVPVAGEVLARMLDDMRFDLVLGYSAYFLLGYLLSGAVLGRGALIALAVAGVAGVVGTVLGTVLVSRAGGEWDELFFGFLTPGVAAPAIAVFCLAQAWGERHSLSGGRGRAVVFLAGASFGIYLVHPLFQWVYRQFGFTTEFAPPFLSVPLLVIAIMVPSALAAVAIQRIPGAGKYLS